jgi:hypothetical protein
VAFVGAADSFERYTYDDQYIYLREDHSDANRGYTFTEGRWLKRSMVIGESVVAGTNRAQHFDVRGGGCAPTEQGIFPYTNTLVSRHQRYHLGSGLGIQDVIVMQYDYRVGGQGEYERMYYAKGLGLVKWELYRDAALLHSSTFTGFSTTPLTPPRVAVACGGVRVRQRVPSLPTTIDEFVGVLYRCILAKEPDSAGLAHWTGSLRSGALSGDGAYRGFFQHQGSVGDDNFVRSVYSCSLFRDPDRDSLNTIVPRLQAGTITREQVLESVLGSLEFTQRVLPVLAALR